MADPRTRDETMLTARVPNVLVSALTTEAARRGVTRSDAVRQALNVWLDTDPRAKGHADTRV